MASVNGWMTSRFRQVHIIQLDGTKFTQPITTTMKVSRLKQILHLLVCFSSIQLSNQTQPCSNFYFEFIIDNRWQSWIWLSWTKSIIRWENFGRFDGVEWFCNQRKKSIVFDKEWKEFVNSSIITNGKTRLPGNITLLKNWFEFWSRQKSLGLVFNCLEKFLDSSKI